VLVTFVDKFARALHKHGKVLSLDVETADYAWWNATALNASALDSMADMSTYRNFADFMISLGIALLEWSPQKIGVGFGNGNRTDTWLRERFEVIEGLGVHEIDVWFVDSLPKNLLPDDWLPHIEHFLDLSSDVNSSAKNTTPSNADERLKTEDDATLIRNTPTSREPAARASWPPTNASWLGNSGHNSVLNSGD